MRHNKTSNQILHLPTLVVWICNLLEVIDPYSISYSWMDSKSSINIVNVSFYSKYQFKERTKFIEANTKLSISVYFDFNNYKVKER